MIDFRRTPQPELTEEETTEALARIAAFTSAPHHSAPFTYDEEAAL